MKVQKILMMMVMALCFVACSDDDDEEFYVVEASPAEEIEGSYTVYTSVTFAYTSTPYVYTSETVTISANDDGTVDVAYSNDTWGDYAISSATVTENSDGSYSVEGEGTAAMASHSGGTTSYDCTLEAEISSDLTLTELVFSVPSVMGGTTITCVEGDAPAALLVTGSYTVYTSVDFAYTTTPYIYTDETVTILANDDGTVDVSYSNDTWGDYTISGATVTENSNGSYTIEGEGTAAMASHSGGTTSYDCTLTATISSDGTLTECVFSVPSVMGGTTVTCIEGDAPGAYIVAGDHTVYTTVLFAYTSTPYVYTGETVTISSNDDGTVDVSYSNDTWGEYTISGATVTEESDGTYSISGDGVAAMASHSGGTTNYDCTLTATADSDGTLTELVFSVPSVMGGTTITCIEGDAPGALVAAGTHSGYVVVSFSYITTPYTYGDQSLTITADDEYTSVDITYTNDTWGTYTVEGATVTLNDDGTYSLSGSGVATISGHSGSASNYDATLSGTIESDGTISELTFYMSFMGGTTVVFYEADYPAAYAVAGDYTGTFALSAMGASAGSVEDMVISIEAEDVDAGTVALTIPEFDITAMGMAMTISAISISGVSVTTDDNETYTLTCDSFTAEEVTYTVSSTSTSVTVTGSVSGTVGSDGSVSLAFTLNLGAMPLTATYTVAADE